MFVVQQKNTFIDDEWGQLSECGGIETSLDDGAAELKIQSVCPRARGRADLFTVGTSNSCTRPSLCAIHLRHPFNPNPTFNLDLGLAAAPPFAL